MAQLTALGVEGARALRTLPSGQVEVVFTTPEAAEAARATPTWVKALDPEASLYSKILSLRVQRANPREAEGFLGAEAAVGAENQVEIFKLLVSKGSKSTTLTLQLTNLEEANKLIKNGLFFEGRAYSCEKWLPVKPTQCYKCGGHFGHTAIYCKGYQKCLTCGTGKHEGPCGSKKSCLN